MALALERIELSSRTTNEDAATSDFYLRFVNTAAGKQLVNALGLPAPVALDRWERADQPFLDGKVLLGAGPGGKATKEIADAVRGGATELFYPFGPTTRSSTAWLAESHQATGLNLAEQNKTLDLKALIFDASGIAQSANLRSLYDFFHPSIRRLARNGRVLLVGTHPEKCRTPAQQALEGFIRSVGKEVGYKGATAQLLWIEPNAQNQLQSSLRFFLSQKSAYVSGQTVRISKTGTGSIAVDPATPLTGKVALVTGASARHRQILRPYPCP